jgi:hypothetical protein
MYFLNLVHIGIDFLVLISSLWIQSRSVTSLYNPETRICLNSLQKAKFAWSSQDMV